MNRRVSEQFYHKEKKLKETILMQVVELENQVKLKNSELPYAVKEELKLLRTNLQFCGADKRVIMVTSALSNEGKSNCSLNICRSFSELGCKVLLIDADLRKSVLKHKIISGHVKQGLSHYLSGMCDFESAIYCSETKNVDIIFSGAVPPNPSELLANDRMTELLAEMRKSYDYIIVDCPPLGIVVDAAVVAPRCDGCVLLLEAGKIKYRFAQDVVAKLKNSGCPILGVVLNKVGHDHSGKYYGRYYSGYYKKEYKEYY